MPEADESFSLIPVSTETNGINGNDMRREPFPIAFDDIPQDLDRIPKGTYRIPYDPIDFLKVIGRAWPAGISRLELVSNTVAVTAI